MVRTIEISLDEYVDLVMVAQQLNDISKLVNSYAMDNDSAVKAIREVLNDDED